MSKDKSNKSPAIAIDMNFESQKIPVMVEFKIFIIKNMDKQR